MQYLKTAKERQFQRSQRLEDIQIDSHICYQDKRKNILKKEALKRWKAIVSTTKDVSLEKLHFP